MTSNYNIIYTGKKTKYKEGDVFRYTGHDWRLEAFNGLKIQSITFNFGDVLHFDVNQWNNRRNGIIPPTTPTNPGGLSLEEAGKAITEISAVLNYGSLEKKLNPTSKI